MDNQHSFTTVVFEPRLDPVVAGALTARAAGEDTDLLVFSSENLPQFFSPGVQRTLPSGYALVLCGQTVVRTDWDGRLVRPEVMRCLRSFVGVVRWFSDRSWHPEDRRAVAHMIGEGKLVLTGPSESLAEVVYEAQPREDDLYGQKLVDFATGRLPEDQEEEWGAPLRRMLSALKSDHRALARAAADLARAELDEVLERESERARRVEAENAQFARENASEPLQVGENKLLWLRLPPDRHPFWAEISREARRLADADFSLCRLEGRPVLLLSGTEDPRVDLRDWARYVTDMLPAAETVGARSSVVPLVVNGLRTEPALENEVLRLLKDGAHLLRG